MQPTLKVKNSLLEEQILFFKSREVKMTRVASLVNIPIHLK